MCIQTCTYWIEDTKLLYTICLINFVHSNLKNCKTKFSNRMEWKILLYKLWKRISVAIVSPGLCRPDLFEAQEILWHSSVKWHHGIFFLNKC